MTDILKPWDAVATPHVRFDPHVLLRRKKCII